MWVYLYPSGTETELKNAYIGGVYEYTYDFRNKSTSQITADGWSYSAWSTPSFSSYGIRGDTSRVTRDLSLTNAQKITVRGYTTIASSNSFAIYIAKTVTSSLRDGISWAYLSTEDNKSRMAIYGTSHDYSWFSSWNYDFERIIDFSTKTWTLAISWKTTQTWTLTDTEVANIRNNTTKLFVYTYSTNSSTWLATVKLTIEY